MLFEVYACRKKESTTMPSRPCGQIRVFLMWSGGDVWRNGGENDFAAALLVFDQLSTSAFHCRQTILRPWALGIPIVSIIDQMPLI